MGTERFGAIPTNQLSNLEAVTDPTASDDSVAGYGVDSRWVNTATNREFVCTDAGVGAAVWEPLLDADHHRPMSIGVDGEHILTGYALTSMNLAAGESFPHGTLWNGLHAVIACRTSPYKLLYLDPTDMTYTVYTSVSNNNALAAASHGSSLYISATSGAGNAVIDKFSMVSNPPSLVSSTSYAPRTVGDALAIDPTGAYLYLGCENGYLVKISTADMSVVATQQLRASGVDIHAIRYDSATGKLFCTDTAGYIYKVDPTNIASFTSQNLGPWVLSDDIALVAGYVICSVEEIAGNVIRVSKADITQFQMLTVGPLTAGGEGCFEDPDGVTAWGCWNCWALPGVVSHFMADGTVLEMSELDTGENVANEIIFYAATNAEFLVTCALDPAKVVKLVFDPTYQTLSGIDASATQKGHLKLANQLGGTAALPTVTGLTETSGPTALALGAVADGQFLKRSGSSIIGAAAGGGGFTYEGLIL
jgi:hypothetical protein